MHMNRRASNLLGLLLTCCCFLAATPAKAGTVWYSGDSDAGSNGLPNVINGAFTESIILSNFVVPGGGWNVTGLFTNNAMDYTGVTSASWVILSGVSSGNPGTLIASGFSVPATQTTTGRTVQGLAEYTIEVAGLNVNLAPGQYWFGVTPDGQGGNLGLAEQTTTTGTNSIGIPNGFTSSPFIFSPDFGAFFEPTTDFGMEFSSFSGGIDLASQTPEPASLVLFASALTGMWLMRKRVRRPEDS
jgi:hypothetical protein